MSQGRDASPARGTVSAVTSAAMDRRAGIVGMAVFVGSDALAFAALLFTYAGLRLDASAWDPAALPSVALGAGMTVALATVSGALVAARSLAARARPGAARGAIAVALAGALAFVGAQIWEIQALSAAGLALGEAPADSFYVITAYHGVHVLGGALHLATLLPRRELGARLVPTSIYWHFVDGVWLLLFAVFYLLAA